MRLGSAADEDRPSIEHRDMGRGESFSPVTFVLGFAVRSEIFIIDRALLPPNCLAGLFIERHNKLMIAAVEIHDQQIVEEDRR